MEREKGGWIARVNALDLDAADVAGNSGVDWRSRGLEAKWSKPNEGAFDVAAKADVVVLQSITPLLAYLPESERLAHLRALNLRGTVRDVNFTARRDSADASVKYTASAAVDAIGFDSIGKVPGFTGISGTLQTNEQKGEFKLDSGPIHVSLPFMFRWPIDTNAVRGVFTWNDDGQALHLNSDKIEFDANDGKGEAKLAVRVPHDGSSPVIDLTAQARDMNAAATPKYLPASTLGEASSMTKGRGIERRLTPTTTGTL